MFTKQFDVDFIHVHAEDRYAELLAGVTEPEEKRRIIGTQFWKEFFAVAQELESDGEPVKYLAQGTIYPDIIESWRAQDGRQGVHHQEPPQPDPVPRGRALRPDRAARPLLQGRGPCAGYWRSGCPITSCTASPSPGPGLAIRIIGAVDAREARDPQECRRYRA